MMQTYLPDSYVLRWLDYMHIKTKWKEMCRKTKQMLVDPQPLASTNVAELVPPEIRHRNRQTDTNRDLDYT